MKLEIGTLLLLVVAVCAAVLVARTVYEIVGALLKALRKKE